MALAKIDINQDIQPLSEFRKNAADYIERIKKHRRSIVLTQHGKSAAVLVEVSEYQRMIDKIELLEDIIESEKEIASGEVVSHEKALSRIKKNLQKWK